MSSLSKRSALALALAALGVSRPTSAGPVDDLKPGEWYEVPSSHMKDVDPCPMRDCSYSAVEGQAGVMNDWSGGAYDTLRDRLIIWGGGHGGYAGNEIYAFDLTQLKWSRITEPSDPPAKDVPYAPDGLPTSRHTYNYVQYVAAIDSFCTFGGAGFYQSGQTGTNHTDCFGFASNKWEHKADSLFNGIGAMSAYDPIAKRVWGKGTGSSPSYEVATALADWDPVANMFTARDQGNVDLANAYYITAAIDPTRHLLIAIGGGSAFVWNIADPKSVKRSNLGATGGTEIEATNTPGFEYDPKSDRMVAWSGGGKVYSLDLDKKAWTGLDPAPTSGPVPGAANMNGTFGRFRYSPAKNVFVVVSTVDTNVFVYKLSAGAGVPQPDAGVVSTDGGQNNPSEDSGSHEAGVGQPDGSSNQPGGRDAGPGGDDASIGPGLAAPTASSDSGCTCKVARRTNNRETGQLAAIVLAACFGCRRSRRLKARSAR